MINWGIANQGGGVQNALAQGFQLGDVMRQRREQREERNALMDQRERQIALAEKNAAGQAARQERDDRRADLPMMLGLLNSVTDEASYQRGLQVAQQYGIDVSGLPQQYNPQWVEQQKQTLAMLQTPQGQEVLSTIGKAVADGGFRPGTPEFAAEVNRRWALEQSKTIPYQPGGNVLEYNPATGTQRSLVQGQAAPISGPNLPPGFQLDEGGPTQPASGGF